jgi:predicted ribosomally synthesized peptide with nif11-like leader
MSIQSAKDYIGRMRADETFRRQVNDCTDEAANWAFLKENGFEFTLPDFKRAQDEIYKEHGITPL